MNIETLESNAAVEVVETNERFEPLALSVDDLDLIGGGASLGLLI